MNEQRFKINPKYKDRLFCLIFGDENEKLLIHCIRENEAEGMRIEEAIDTAVQHCINCNVLREFLVAHRAEVVSVCLTEFNEKVFVASMKAEGELAMAIRLVKKGYLSIDKAVEELQMSEDEFLKLLEAEESSFAE